MNNFYNKIIAVFLSVCMLAGTVAPVFAQKNQSVEYAQDRLMLADEKGDQVLSRLFFVTCETGIKKCLLFENVPPQESQLRVPRFAEENPILTNVKERATDNSKAKPTFDVERTFLNLRKIIVEEGRNGIFASVGEPHSWTKDYKNALSKIVMALATASSSRFLYVGNEKELIAWIKSCPDNSVTIEDLFRQSYILNRGNVYLTILSIENVLSDATFEAERENTLINQKLVDLYKDSPNKFGDWYHFFGTMLAGYVGEPIDLIVQLYSMYRKISRGEAAEKATLAADKAGADIGSDLRKFMMEDSFNLRRVLAEDLKKKLEKGNKVFSRKIYAEQQDKISVAPKY